MVRLDLTFPSFPLIGTILHADQCFVGRVLALNIHNNEGYEHHNASRDGLLTQYYTRLISYLKQFIRQHATYIISKGPAFLNAMLVAAPTDLSVWLIESRMSDILHPKNKSQNGLWRWQSSWPFWALVCSITSLFRGYALIRTYAKSFETMCLVVGIALLGPVVFFCLVIAMKCKEASANIISPKQDNRREIECNDTNDNPLFSLLGIITPYTIALVFGTQGIPLLTSNFASRLHYGGSCHCWMVQTITAKTHNHTQSTFSWGVILHHCIAICTFPM